jgi:hypothetical protein
MMSVVLDEADAPAFWYEWLVHHFPDRIKNHFELAIILGFQLVESAHKAVLTGNSLSQTYECPDDIEAYLHGERRIEPLTRRAQ